MPPKCFICKFYDPKRMSLFRIPNRKDEYSERAKVWIKLLNAKKENVDAIRICSIHFLKSIFCLLLFKLAAIQYSIFTEKPSKADDYLDVDWVPNQHLGEYSKNWKKVQYYIRKKNETSQVCFIKYQFFMLKVYFAMSASLLNYGL